MRDLPTVCEQLHLPVQAVATTTLLRRMRRLYTVDEYRVKIAAAVGTVGPRLALEHGHHRRLLQGETDAEFAGTESLMRELRFDTVHLAAYSVRPGTAAARRVDDVPREEKRARLNHLLALQREVAADAQRQRQTCRRGGRTARRGRRRFDGARPYGRTRENKVAWLPAVGAARVGELQERHAWRTRARGSCRSNRSARRREHKLEGSGSAPSSQRHLRRLGTDTRPRDGGRDTPIPARVPRPSRPTFPDAIVLARLGDFFEMFGPDAEKAAPILGLALNAGPRLRRRRAPADVRRSHTRRSRNTSAQAAATRVNALAAIWGSRSAR